MAVKLLNRFTLGADPEFVAFGPRGAQKVFSRDDIAAPDIVGYDHGGRVLELRPEPSRGAYALVRKMRRTWHREHANTALIKGFRLKAGGMAGQDTLGGHVHFGFEGLEWGHLSQDQLVALDAVTAVLIRLDLLATEESRDRMAKGDAMPRGYQYGSYSDVRNSDYSQEYRTMPSWLYSPKTAFLAIAAAKLAACEPAGTAESLTPHAGFPKLEEWITALALRDDNARRIKEKFFPLRDLAAAARPDADLNAVWGGALGF